jgi:guanosine-3',5'-bis(diphosphate) 3'-pyrophosphohydrolase
MIPEAELQKITAKYDALLAVTQGLLKEDDRLLLENAFKYSRDLYGETRHLTGELLICHCLSIARIAVEEMGLGVNSIVAALLHDAFITQSVSIEDIRKKFGTVIADMVGGSVTCLPVNCLFNPTYSESSSLLLWMISGSSCLSWHIV